MKRPSKSGVHISSILNMGSGDSVLLESMDHGDGLHCRLSHCCEAQMIETRENCTCLKANLDNPEGLKMGPLNPRMFLHQL